MAPAGINQIVTESIDGLRQDFQRKGVVPTVELDAA